MNDNLDHYLEILRLLTIVDFDDLRAHVMEADTPEIALFTAQVMRDIDVLQNARIVLDRNAEPR